MKKVLAIMLVCFMLVSLLPMGALAAENEAKCPGEGEHHYKTNCEYTFVKDFEGVCGGYDYTVYQCNECGDKFAADFVKIDGTHNYEVTKTPTHSKPGEQVCTICGHKETVECDGKPGALEGNCLEGWIAKCDKCGETLESKPGEHAWGKLPSAIVKEPTATEDGLAEYTCGVCGVKKEVVILSHICAENLEAVEAKEPGCVDDGNIAHDKCTVCGKLYINGFEVSDVVLPNLGGHTVPETVEYSDSLTLETMYEYTDWYTMEYPVTVTFTASEDLYTTSSWYAAAIKIQNAEEWYGSLYANEDVVVLGPGESVTYTLEAGVTYRVYGNGIGTLTYTYSVGAVTIPGDCTTSSVLKYNCAVCGEAVEEDLGLNHNWAVTYHTEPTCTTYGYTIESCLDCGEHSITRHDPLGHTTFEEALELGIVQEGWNNGSCEFDNEYYWYCELCGEEQTLVLPPNEHAYAEKHVAAACGSYRMYFKFCMNETTPITSYAVEHAYVNAATGEILYFDYATVLGKEAGYPENSSYYDREIYALSTDTIEVEEKDYWGDTYTVEYPVVWVYVEEGYNANHHNPGDKYEPTVIEPSCTEDGLTIYWCVDCQKDVVEILPALGHEWAEELLVVDPTCDMPGYIAQVCTVCGELNWETIEFVELDEQYVYSKEDAEIAHDIEGVTPEQYRPGDCEVVGLDRYQCATCGQYILVKDETTGFHVMPEILLEKDDPNNTVSEIPEGVVDYDSETITGANVTVKVNPGEDIYFTFVATADGVLAGTRLSATGYAVCGSVYLHGGETMNVVAGQTYTINIWSNCEIYLYLEGQTARELEFCGKDATCTEAGYTAQWYCVNCGKFFASEEIKATGHKEVIDVEASKPTCTEVGCTKGSHCEICGEILYVSEEIPALGHTYELVDFRYLPEDGSYVEYTYEHWQCTVCRDEYIRDYVSYCKHELSARPVDHEDPTCEQEGFNVFKCKHCDYTETVVLEKLPHVNAAGQDLTKCHPSITDFKCVNGCKNEFAKVEHSLDGGLYYEANCLTNAYIMYNCTECAHYEVVDIDDKKGDHSWSDWAPVVDDNGVIVAETCACRVCGEVDIRDVETIAYSAEIEGAITDGSLVKVVIAISGDEDFAWGFKLNVAYSENLKFVEAKFVTTSFTYANVATNHEGYVTILANADGEVELNGKENLVELYFTVNAPEVSEIAVGFVTVETLDAEGKPVEFVAYGDTAKTVKLMDLDLDGEVTLADALAAYNVITAAGYNVAADLDGDGAVTLVDYLNLFNYLSGALTYEEVVALR